MSGMSDPNSLLAKISKLLENMPESARESLRRKIAEAQKKAPDPLYSMLNEALQSLATPPQRRQLHPSRCFFKPLERFLINDRPYEKTSGRIWRGALQPIWNWIENNVAEDEVRSFRSRLQEGEAKRDDKNFEDDLLTAILPKLQNVLEKSHETPETRRRFAYYLGGEHQLQEFEDIVAILTHRDIISAFPKTLPTQPSLHSQSDLLQVSRLFTKIAHINPRLPYYAAATLQSYLEQRTQLPLWAAACACSDDLREVANSPFAALIETALGDASLAAEQCIAELKKPCEDNEAIRYVQNYALTCRNLRAAVDFEAQNSEWLRRLSETRLRISNALAEELGQTFQLLRRNVRPLRAFGTQNPFPPDEFDIGKLCFLIELLMTVRAYLNEFALNEIANRLFTECENYLQIAIDSLQDELRSAQNDKRTLAFAYAQAAIRVSEIWYGKEHAALLKRSFETAGASAIPVQKASA